MTTLNYKTTVELERHLVENFRELYPQRGALKTFFNACLKRFAEVHDHESMSRELSITVEEAVEDLKEEYDESD